MHHHRHGIAARKHVVNLDGNANRHVPRACSAGTRGEFLKQVGVVGFGSGVIGASLFADDEVPGGKRPLRIGFVGIGNRGSAHLDISLARKDINVPAICDIDETNLQRAKTWVEESGRPTPTQYGRDETDFRRMCEQEELDLVVASTPWRWHTPICIAAMTTGKHVATEVPAALTVEECWQLVETSEKSKRICTMLEQANYASFNLMVLQMARHGVFGELVHAAGGYVYVGGRCPAPPLGRGNYLQTRN